ncbi:MAG: hypothetical protein KKF33_13745 [Alphaproteobacteria bacterium]|nr:hypothetical protein [Alphaproteobacteria bacterium]
MIEQVAAWATTVGVPIGLVGIGFAIYQTSLARRTASASVTLASWEAFRAAWQRYDEAADDAAMLSAFNDVLNLIEANCAIFRDGLLIGHAGDSLQNYLVNTLVKIDRSDKAVQLVGELMETDTTFSDIRWFLAKQQAKSGDLLVRLQNYANAPSP